AGGGDRTATPAPAGSPCALPGGRSSTPVPPGSPSTLPPSPEHNPAPNAASTGNARGASALGHHGRPRVAPGPPRPGGAATARGFDTVAVQPSVCRSPGNAPLGR